MHHTLSFALASVVLGSALCAQVVISPYGPGVVGTPTTNPELGNLSLGVTEVSQTILIPNPAGPGYLGHATVKKIGVADWDVMSFTWAGPGNAPVVTTDVDGLNGPGDEFQCSLSSDGLALVMDCGAGNTNSQGINAPILATRPIPSGTFTVVARLTGGFPAAPGYYDPQLARFDIDNDSSLDDVVYYAAPAGGIGVGKVDRTTGVVSNVISAIPALTALPGFQFCHSPTPTDDVLGISRGLLFSVYALSTGSDAYYYPATTETLHPLASIGPYAMFDDGTQWNANPSNLKGTAFYAKAGGVYGDQLQIDYVSLSSASIVASTGGIATHVGQYPLSLASATMLSAVNLGFSLLPTPIDPNVIGLVGYGRLCVSPSASIGVAPGGSEFILSFPVPAGLPVGVVYAQSIAFNLANNEFYLSNVAALELR